MTENLRSLDSLSFFMSESLEVTRKAHVFAILLGKLLQRNILEPTDIIRASEWLLLYAEHDGFVQGFCALLLSGGDKVMKGDQKKLANTTCLRNVLKIARKKLECHGERYAEYQVCAVVEVRELLLMLLSREDSSSGGFISHRGICRDTSPKEAGKTAWREV